MIGVVVEVYVSASVCVCVCVCFFFKRKTAYEMLRSLVGSEMCIRDRGRKELQPLISSSDGMVHS